MPPPRIEPVALLKRLVEWETPSVDHRACGGLQEVLAAELIRLGAVVDGTLGRNGSPVLIARFAGIGRPVLVLGHVDTVFPVGTVARRPFTVRGSVATGPGVLDMKAGLVQLLLALRELLAEPDAPALTVVLNADEELGSPDSAPIILREAARCRCALVLEPSGPGGALKTRRKGIGLYRFEVTGAAAHPGLDFASGVSATVELSHQVVAASALTDGGSTVNVGVIGGGSGRNVVAARAFAELETRFWSIEDGERLDRRLRTLTAVDPRAEVTVTGGIHRVPLSRASSGGLADLAMRCARSQGWELGEVAVGGVSDGNLTAAAGLSTVDGLGAVGGGAHGDDEYVLLDELPVRAALLSGLLLAIARK